MNGEYDELIAVILWLVFIAVIFAMITLGWRLTQIQYVDNIPVEVYVDKEMVYKGKSIGIKIDSSGANSTVTVYGGFLYYFPQATYVSKDVEVIGDKRK